MGCYHFTMRADLSATSMPANTSISLVQVGILQMEIQHRRWPEKACVSTKAHRICFHNYNHYHLFVIKGDQAICTGDFVFEGVHCPLVSASVQQ